MAGKFSWVKFRDCNIDDEFFLSLKGDYPEFVDWFKRKAIEGKEALVFSDENGIGAFICFKPHENENIGLTSGMLPEKDRFKISTLKISERYQGNRLGEGALGVALWQWQEEQNSEIYITVFDKHHSLIDLLNRFGFVKVGIKKDSLEGVYLRSRRNVDYSDPYKSFPFINPTVTKVGCIPIQYNWHDTLFPFSELRHTKQQAEEIAAANGITKIYIATPYSSLHHNVGDPVFIYRISDRTPKTFHSAITSVCTITDIEIVKQNGRNIMTYEDYIKRIGNKSVFSPEELRSIYMSKAKNIIAYELLYNSAFGSGCNVNQHTLQSNGLWFDMHPYLFAYSVEQFNSILKLGKKDPNEIVLRT